MSVIQTSLAERREILARCILAETRKGHGPFSEQQSARIAAWGKEMDELEVRLEGNSEEKYQRAFEGWLRYGHAALRTPDADLLVQKRAATIGLEGGGAAYPGSTNGTVVPLAYADSIVAATKYAGPLMQLATVDMTADGRTKAYPGIGDTSVSAAFLSEANAAAVHDVSSNLVTLGGYKVHSGIVKMSREAAEDIKAYPNLHGFLAEAFGVRFGRLINQYATIGSGSSQPTGFITAASSAVATIVGASANDGTSNSHNSLGTSDFQTCQNALDYSYWVNASWQVHPTTLAVITSQLDKQGRLLFPGLQNDTQTVNGKRVFVNPWLDPLPASGPNSPTISTNVLALGDWSRFIIRLAPFIVVRLEETYAFNGQIGWAAYTRFDANLQDGGGGAIKYMTCTY